MIFELIPAIKLHCSARSDEIIPVNVVSHPDDEDSVKALTLARRSIPHERQAIGKIV